MSASTAMAIALASATLARGAETPSAHVTHLANRVELQSGSGDRRPVGQNEVIANGESLRTGSDSALELTFDDGTFARFGSKTDVRMQSANQFDLRGGAMLVHVPQRPTTTEIETPLVSVASSGATFAVETYQPNDVVTRCRITVLEGTVRVCRSDAMSVDSKVVIDAPNECTTVEAKHAFFASTDQSLGSSVKVDLGAWLASNALITSFPPLKPALLALIGAPAHANMTLAAIFGGMGTEFAFSNALGTINPGNLSEHGNEVSPSEERLTICHNGTTLTLPRDAAEEHLRKHSRDSAGACR
ncbi:MAG: FecR domain-containing protein [Chthoniobacterales bacterium]